MVAIAPALALAPSGSGRGRPAGDPPTRGKDACKRFRAARSSFRLACRPRAAETAVEGGQHGCCAGRGRRRCKPKAPDCSGGWSTSAARLCGSHRCRLGRLETPQGRRGAIRALVTHPQYRPSSYNSPQAPQGARQPPHSRRRHRRLRPRLSLPRRRPLLQSRSLAASRRCAVYV